MAADIAILDWSKLSYAGGCYDPVDCIVMSGDARMVDTVIVNGGALTRIDEEEKRQYVNAVGRGLLCKSAQRLPALQADLQ